MFQEILRRLRHALTRDDQARAAIDHLGKAIGLTFRPGTWTPNGNPETDTSEPAAPAWHDQKGAIDALSARIDDLQRQLNRSLTVK